MIDTNIELELVNQYYQTYKFVDIRFHSKEIENYLNSTFQIQAVYGKHSCVVLYERKLYQITPSLGRYSVDLVRRPTESEGFEHQEYHFLLVNHLTECREFEDALNFIDDEARLFVEGTIATILEHHSKFGKRVPEVNYQIEYGIQNHRLLQIKTNLKKFDLRGVNGYDSTLMVGFMCADLEIDSVLADENGITFVTDSYKCQERLAKKKIFPDCINSRTPHQCDVADCPKTPMRGKELCHEHLIDYENGVSLPTYARGEEGEDVVACICKNIACSVCDKSNVDWRKKEHWIKVEKLDAKLLEELDSSGTTSFNEETREFAICFDCQREKLKEERIEN